MQHKRNVKIILPISNMKMNQMVDPQRVLTMRVRSRTKKPVNMRLKKLEEKYRRILCFRSKIQLRLTIKLKHYFRMRNKATLVRKVRI